MVRGWTSAPARGTVPSPWHRPQPRAHGPRAGSTLGISEQGGQGVSRAFSSEAVGVVRKGRCGQGMGKPVVGVWLAEQDLLRRPCVAWKSLPGSGSSPKEGCKSWEGFGLSPCVCCSTTALHSPEPPQASPASGHLPNSPSSSRVGGPSACSVSKAQSLEVRKKPLSPWSLQRFCCFSVLCAPVKLQSFHSTDRVRYYTGVLDRNKAILVV